MSEEVGGARNEGGAKVWRMGANAPYTNGIAERRVRTIKTIMQAGGDLNTTPNEAIKSICSANDAVGFRPLTILEGFSPYTAETGRNPPIFSEQEGPSFVKGAVRARRNIEAALQQIHANHQIEARIEKMQEGAKKPVLKNTIPGRTKY